MALTNTCVRLLVWAKEHGASFEKTLTLGHLENNTDWDIIISLSKKHPNHIDINKIRRDEFFADSIFSALGAQKVDSLDKSNYENASLIYDLNEPLPLYLHNKYTTLIDGGTLEHVFNFPQAIKNCMQALCVDGHFIGFSPVNNLMGHGFYQFSPELFYRILSEENGFKIKGMFLVASNFEIDATTWYAVSDPKDLNERVTLTNSLPVYLMVVAKKISEIVPFRNQQYQSDYLDSWNKIKVPSDKLGIKISTLIQRIIKKIFRRSVSKENLQKINSKFFKRYPFS